MTIKKIIWFLYFYSTAIAVFDSMNCTTRPGLITMHHRHATDTIMRLMLNEANIQNTIQIHKTKYMIPALNTCPCPRGWETRNILVHNFKSNRIIYALISRLIHVDCSFILSQNVKLFFLVI